VLNLRLSQNRQHVKCNQKTTLFVLLEITTDESTHVLQKRKHVSLVMDCSGSMHGKKLDDAKNAAMEVVRSLSPQDLVSIVTFASNVDVKLNPTPASDRSIEGVIRSIQANGATALHGGIASAFQLLKQTSAPDIINRMEVFSDGEPNIEPYDDDDFMQLASMVRDNGVTIDVFGIGDDYNGSLLMQVSEIGRGKWEHVSDSESLTKMVGSQIEEMQNTVITNPQLQIILMDGAELATMAITKPILQEVGLESRQMSANTTHVGLNDIIKDETQTVVMRIAIPPIEGNDVSFLTAAVMEGSKEIASQTAAVSCTVDKDLYNLETDPSPRVILASSEATMLLRKGLDNDPEATQMANTILKSLDDPETTKLMDEDAHATVVNARTLAGNIQPGMSESERKQALHDTTVIGTVGAKNGTKTPELKCSNCNHTVRSTSKICGNCGKVINR